ncbi:hypothetical protein [Synechococcus sp. GFB01]|uniref:hypothetical protein n=1 Tax=Synechococcus sp. GFB01 TaxID=1662190 RepID=UPI00064F773C|nr:hypothetical protein [Synechococcus sp. GFB01]KMM16334.1 hypothetical protein SYNGFB01_11815 [Synechococcus sp. GFB01]
MAEPLPWLSERQRGQLRTWLDELRRAPGWSGHLPVALLDRCWLRLRSVPVAALAARLPPDTSADAPELTRYRQLIARGLPGLTAQQLCWEEFGSASCQLAQQRFWQCQERGNHGWTLARYLELVQAYRERMESDAPRELPLLVLARPGSDDAHQLHWLQPLGLSMRHTCA